MCRPVIPSTLQLSPLLKSIDDKLSSAQDQIDLGPLQYAQESLKEARALLLKGVFQGFIIETSPHSNISQNKKEEPTQHELEKQTAQKILQIKKEQTP